MSKSRSRLAADWFAKLRTNPTTQVVEHTDVVDVEADVAAISVTPADVSDQSNTSTGYLDIPSGTTAQRPSSANSGYTRYNTDLGSVEFYDGTNWIATNLIPEITSISGTIYSGANSPLTINMANNTDIVDVTFSANGSTVATFTGQSATSGAVTITTTSAMTNLSSGTVFTVVVKNQDGTPSSSQTLTSVGTPSGGDSISTYTSGGNTYLVNNFTSSGTLNLPSNATVDIFYIAGGGSVAGEQGSAGGTGGGGAGGVVYYKGKSLNAGNYTITIGAGGASTSANDSGARSGNDTTFTGLTTASGGGLSTQTNGNMNGGSGGGSGFGGNVPKGNQGSGVTHQGHAGGGGSAVDAGTGGGGGGAGEAGDADGAGYGGDGILEGTSTNLYDRVSGQDVLFEVNGSANWYGGGGGAGSINNDNIPGGQGGGGNGSYRGTRNHGAAGTGGGGGGVAYAPYMGGNGGSGVCFVRYKL
jgi:hypothetical protein